MHPSLRKTLVSLCVLGAVAVGGAAIAGAASNNDSSSSSGSSSGNGSSTTGQNRPPGLPPRRSGEKPLTGTTAAKVKAAALAKVPGATVERLETDADQGAAYEAHVRKSDGSRVTVLVDKSFKVVAVRRGCGGPGGPRGPGRPGGANGAGYGGPPPPPAGYDQGGYGGPAPYGAVPN
jgi:hypothetical protein